MIIEKKYRSLSIKALTYLLTYFIQLLPRYISSSLFNVSGKRYNCRAQLLSWNIMLQSNIKIVTSAKEVMFYLVFIFPLVFL